MHSIGPRCPERFKQALVPIFSDFYKIEMDETGEKTPGENSELKTSELRKAGDAGQQTLSVYQAESIVPERREIDIEVSEFAGQLML